MEDKLKRAMYLGLLLMIDAYFIQELVKGIFQGYFAWTDGDFNVVFSFYAFIPLIIALSVTAVAVYRLWTVPRDKEFRYRAKKKTEEKTNEENKLNYEM